MKTEKILGETINLYRGCKSFRAESRFVVSLYDFKSQPLYEFGIAFRTWFSRPNSWRLEWAPIVPTGYSANPSWSTIVGDKSQATSLSGKERRTFGSFDDAIKMSQPFAGHLLTFDLLKETNEPSPLDQVRGTVRLPDQEVDGRNCYHLGLYTGKNMEEIHLWIDTGDNIIRKVERAVPPLLRAPMQLVSKLLEKVSSNQAPDPSGGGCELYDDVEVNALIHPTVFSV